MDSSVIRHLEVCAGIGGFSLGLSLADARIRTVGFVERQAYCAAVLLARMEDATLDPAPVFCGELQDVEGSALCGSVDLITAGFPCQPWSVAGSRKGTADERWLWPDIAKLIAAVEPSAVLLENVSLKAFQQPLEDLRDMGLELSPSIRIGACDVGAPHRRYRYFALAHCDGGGQQGVRLGGLLNGQRAPCRNDFDRCDTDVGDAAISRFEGGGAAEPPGRRRPYPPGRGDDAGWSDWGNGPQPGLRRDVDGLPSRLDRLHALGNSVMPQMVAAAWQWFMTHKNVRRMPQKDGEA